MKTILVATDFSAASRNASLYGIALARLLDAKIILFNAYQIPSQMPSLNVEISEYGVLKDAEQKLADEAGYIKQRNKVVIESVCEHGEAERTISKIAKEKNADFIIIGMKGRGKNIRKVFGSTATALANSTNVPLIVVPEVAKFSIPKIILYASDILLDTNIQQIDQIKSITALFKSKLYVVRIVQDEYAEIFERSNTPPRLREELQILDTTFEYPVDTDIRHALNEFINKHHVDMLVMMPHKHEWFKRLFKKSETKDMIFHTHVPILILPETPSEQRLPNRNDVKKEMAV